MTRVTAPRVGANVVIQYALKSASEAGTRGSDPRVESLYIPTQQREMTQPREMAIARADSAARDE